MSRYKNGNGNGHPTDEDEDALAAVEEDDPLDDIMAQLSIRERRFVDAYLGEAAGAAFKAAKLAGYVGSHSAIATQAWKMMRKRHVKMAIRALVEMDPLVPARVERMRLIGKIARGEATEERLNGVTGEVTRVCAGLNLQLAALKLLSELYADSHVEADSGLELPPNLTIDELFDLAGVPRSIPTTH